MGRAHQVVDAHEDGVVVVGYAGAVARSDVAVGQQLVERAVGVGYGAVVEVAAEDYGALALLT